LLRVVEQHGVERRSGEFRDRFPAADRLAGEERVRGPPAR
jgi:hypothetical protein